MQRTIVASFLMFLSLSAFAQLPKTAEDISPLLVGEIFPDFELTSIEGKAVDLKKAFGEKKSIVIFYRGGWCPYCTRHLSAIGQVEEEILDKGFQIIAVSPDSPEKLEGTLEKESLKYRLLSDADGKLAKAAGISFQAPAKYADHLSKHSGGKNAGFLPVPSVFVLDTEGRILFEHINPNYQSRLKPELLLAVLGAL